MSLEPKHVGVLCDTRRKIGV